MGLVPVFFGIVWESGHGLTFEAEDERMNEVLPKSGPVAQLGARFHGMEEVIGSIPIRSTNSFNNLRRLPRILKGPKRSNKRMPSLFTDFLPQHPHHSGLRLTLGRSDRLRVHLERHLNRGVPEKLLHHLDVLAVGLEQS